jgi:hypothetical protein
MKVTETTLKPASLLQKELRDIEFKEITKDDYEKLYWALMCIFAGRRNCILQVGVGWTGVLLKNEGDTVLFATGFLTALRLADLDNFIV